MRRSQRHGKRSAPVIAEWRIAAWALALALLGAAGPAAFGEWRYVVPPADDPFEHPPLRALAMLRERPDDVKELVRYRGARQRYAQLRYGSPGSVRVTVVVDEVAPGDADLYVDANRNRRIEARDRVAGKNRVWRLPIAVAVVEGEMTKLTPRAAIFRLGATGLTFSYAAAGYLEGKVTVGGREHAARRSDGDGNGFLTDAQDRLWIDLDDDGRWDPTGEQFLYATILSLGAARYAVRSDELGTRLALETLEGIGTVRLKLNRPASAPPVAEVHSTLIGRDGSAVGLGGEADGVTVPAGEYRVGTVIVALEDPGGGPRWSFIFSDDGARPGHKWYRVESGGTVEIDPVGKLEMQTGLEVEAKAVRAGDDLALQPKLYTGDGLLINTCFRGTPSSPGGHDGASADIKLTGTGEQPLAVACSGFA
jgi:hypothetical protein